MVDVIRPKQNELPILFTSPHSGRCYPDDFGSSQPLSILRRAEDAYVDRLIAGTVSQGVTLIQARFPRAYLDVNRDEDDLDPLIIEGLNPKQSGIKSQLGIGLIRRLVTPEYPIYQRTLSSAEVQQRLRRCYYPYHAEVAATLEHLSAEGDPVIFIDWHSMKSVGNAATPDGPGTRRPDIVIGDRQGESCSGDLTKLLVQHFRESGYSVAINNPYAGGATLVRYGRPDQGVHAVQIEINRALYLDEVAVTLTEGAAPLSRVISGLLPCLKGWIREKGDRLSGTCTN